MRDLTKWPRLLVVGEPVTETQANEILVRTDDWMLLGNDREWEGIVANLAGIERDKHGTVDWGSRERFRKAMGVLELGYLENGRIYSAWIGGPKGWCDWDGTIGCSTWNIGKWPSHEAVTEDWTAIAAAFPYLDLVAQLVTDEGAGEVAGEWVVRNGEVRFDPEPGPRIRRPEVLDDATVLLRFAGVTGERGVDFARLAEALRQVRGGAA